MSQIMQKLGIKNTDWKTYENDDFNSIVWTNDAKCTETEWDDAIKQIAQEHKKLQYQRDRKYPNLGEQFDLLFKDIDSGKVSKDGGFYKAVKAVKDAHPKPSE